MVATELYQPALVFINRKFLEKRCKIERYDPIEIRSDRLLVDGCGDIEGVKPLLEKLVKMHNQLQNIDHDISPEDIKTIISIYDFIDNWTSEGKAYLKNDDNTVSRVIGAERYLLENGQIEAFWESKPKNVSRRIALEFYTGGGDSVLQALRKTGVAKIDEKFAKEIGYWDYMGII